MKRLTTTLLAVCNVLVLSSTVAQIYNRPYPEGTFPYEFSQITTVPEGYFLTTAGKLFVMPSNPAFVSPHPMIIDKDGYLVWYAKPNVVALIDFKYQPTSNLFTYTSVATPQGPPTTQVLDANFNLFDALGTTSLQDIHDVQLADNGNWLIMTVYTDTMDLSMYTFDGIQGDPNTIVKGIGYEEIDPSGTLIRDWNSNDFLSPTETLDFWGYNATNFDYSHANAIDEDSDGNILISHRHLNSIHKIDRESGEVLWRLGGELSDFTFTNDNGFSGQHDCRWQPNGELSLFDNGNMSGITRGVSYMLDTVNWTATKTNEFIHPNTITSTAMGGYSITSSGYELLTYGLVYRPDPSITMVDASHNLVAEIIFQDSVVCYRGQHVALTLPSRPEISCNWNGLAWEISVPSGFSEYAWSTGATTNSIEITQAGTYQVWVNQGIGMIGSYPIVVSDPNDPCSMLGIEELASNEGNYRLFNLLGQEVHTPEKNLIYMKVWESGYAEKVIFGE